MTDIELLRRAWVDADAGPSLTGEALTEMVRNRTRVARHRVTQRLRAELATYAAITVGALAVMIVKPPSVWLPTAAALLAVFAATGGVIFFRTRALQRVSIDGTLRESLARMIAILSGWMTLYLIGYMAVIAGGGALVLAMLARSRGIGPLWWLAAGGCALALVWGYASGREYTRREFGGHLDELRRALDDLEDA